MATFSKWSIDHTHSSIAFKIKHLMVAHILGYFDSYEGTVVTDNDQFINAKVFFKAQIDSINTRNRHRDEHLKSDHFFNMAIFPVLTFYSISYDGQTMLGGLTMKGQTKEVLLQASFSGIKTDPFGFTRAGFKIGGKINRKAFGLAWSGITDQGTIIVGNEVQLIIDLELVKKSV